MSLRSVISIPAALLFLIPSLACTQQTPPKVKSYLTGIVTVSSAVDSTHDYSGIEIIVTGGLEAGSDTLGYAVTAKDGSFSTDVVAPERGVYPLIMKRGGAVLSVNEFVVVDSDSSSLRAELPLGQRLPMIRSRENSAWLAFKNAEAQHSGRIMDLIKGGDASQDQLGKATELSAEVLWSVKNAFPGTVAASVAATKSIVMLEGWNDSLLVERLYELDPDQPGFLDGVQAGGRAQVRLHGLESGVALLRSMRALAPNEDIEARIQREIVQAYVDARKVEPAFAAIDTLEQKYSAPEWSDWASRERYEIHHLFPGKPAPVFDLATRGGGRVNLDSLRGHPVVVEFWSPRDRQYMAELSAITSLLSNDSTGVQWVSVGLETDNDLYDAFFEGREVPGIQVHDENPLMEDLIVRYNIQSVPTRYLIDSEGRILDKYVGESLTELAGDLQRIANQGD